MGARPAPSCGTWVMSPSLRPLGSFFDDLAGCLCGLRGVLRTQLFLPRGRARGGAIGPHPPIRG
eukprot:4291039-Lingulodinium_polyedra.AAC.1